MKWNDLSMKDRATLILLGVASGVYDIGTIRDTYNEFAEGGEASNNTLPNGKYRLKDLKEEEPTYPGYVLPTVEIEGDDLKFYNELKDKQPNDPPLQAVYPEFYLATSLPSIATQGGWQLLYNMRKLPGFRSKAAKTVRTALARGINRANIIDTAGDAVSFVEDPNIMNGIDLVTSFLPAKDLTKPAGQTIMAARNLSNVANAVSSTHSLGGLLVQSTNKFGDGGELNQIQLKPQLNNKVDWLQALRDAGMTAILGPIGSLIPLLRKRKKTENIVDTNIVEEETNPVEFDWNDLRLRQAWTESKNDAKAVSPRGAKGVFLIMDATLLDYLKKTGDIGDIFDPEYNGKVRDYYLNWLMERPVVNTNNPPDSILAAKAMAAYNWGVGNLTDYLIDLKKQGNDIYTSLDWVEGLPKETRDYVNFIVRHRDSGGHRTNNRYKKAFNIE